MGQADKYKENKSEGGQQETHAIDRKGKTKIVTFVGIMTYLIVIATPFLYMAYYTQIKNFLLFRECRIRKMDDKIALLAQILFYFAIFLFVNWILLFLTSILCQNSNLVIGYRRNITSSLEKFVIFIGFYIYVLNKVGFFQKKKEFVLLANWFILSRLIYGIGSLIDVKTNSHIRWAGSILSFVAISILISQIAGYNVFTYI